MLRDAGRVAVGTLTAIPVAPPSRLDRRVAGGAMVLAPLAVLPLGLLTVAIALLGHQAGAPPLVTALLALGVLALGNRALHLDGLSDTVDGLTASYDRARSLAVMDSGTSGPAGVAATVLVLGVQAAALAALLTRPRWWESALLAGVVVCVSRGALVVCCQQGIGPARPEGLGAAFAGTVPRTAAVVVWLAGGVALAAAAAGAGLTWWRGAGAAVAAVVVVVMIRRRASTRLGGVTGDVFGAAVELALAAGLVVLS